MCVTLERIGNFLQGFCTLFLQCRFDFDWPTISWARNIIAAQIARHRRRLDCGRVVGDGGILWLPHEQLLSNALLMHPGRISLNPRPGEPERDSNGYAQKSYCSQNKFDSSGYRHTTDNGRVQPRRAKSHQKQMRRNPGVACHVWLESGVVISSPPLRRTRKSTCDGEINEQQQENNPSGNASLFESLDQGKLLPRRVRSGRNWNADYQG